MGDEWIFREIIERKNDLQWIDCPEDVRFTAFLPYVNVPHERKCKIPVTVVVNNRGSDDINCEIYIGVDPKQLSDCIHSKTGNIPAGRLWYSRALFPAKKLKEGLHEMALACEPRTSSFHTKRVGKTALGLATGVWLGKKLSALKLSLNLVENMACPLCSMPMQFRLDDPLYPDGWYCPCHDKIAHGIGPERVNDAHNFAKKNEVSVLKVFSVFDAYDPLRVEERIEENSRKYHLDIGRVMEAYLYRKWKIPDSDAFMDEVFSLCARKDADPIDVLVECLKDEEQKEKGV